MKVTTSADGDIRKLRRVSTLGSQVFHASSRMEIGPPIIAVR